MKIIKIEGCGSCPYTKGERKVGWVCKKILKILDITFEVNPYYSHPDCPLEEVKE